MFNYKFYIEVDIKGNQRPFMVFGSDKNFQHLGNLALGRMSKQERIKEILLELGKVEKNEKEVFHFSADDWCIITFKKNYSVVSNGFDEFKPFEMESHLILKLLQDWYKFLCAYENNEIPGIIHPSK
jgi:hypothetical protein